MIQKIIEIAMPIVVFFIIDVFILACINSSKNRQDKAAKCFKVLKYIIIALIVLILAYCLCIVIPHIKDISVLYKDGVISGQTYLLMLVTFIGIFLLAALFFLTPYFIVRAIRSFSRRDKKQMDKAAKLQAEANDLKEKELDVWKKKHRRVRCPYCGTYNYTTEKTCSSCGAAIPAEDDDSETWHV